MDNNSDSTKSENKKDLKTYRREYYRKLYHTNEEYKEAKKQYNKKLYVNKTVRCIKCFQRNNIDELKNNNIDFDKENFTCNNCKNKIEENEVKSKRGRPRKIINI